MELEMKRSPMKRSTKPMKRGRLGPGLKTKLHKIAIHKAKALWTGSCQYCGEELGEEKHAHHKTPRSELRKAGIPDLDAPHRLLIVHPWCHAKIHAGGMGRPKEENAAAEFRFVETSDAHAGNGKTVRGIP